MSNYFFFVILKDVKENGMMGFSSEMISTAAKDLETGIHIYFVGYQKIIENLHLYIVEQQYIE